MKILKKIEFHIEKINKSLKKNGLKGAVKKIAMKFVRLPFTIFDKTMVLFKVKSYLNQKSQRFWEKSSYTFLADAAYYDRQETALREIISKIRVR